MATTRRKLKIVQRRSSVTIKKGGTWKPRHQSQERIFQETFVYLMTNIPVFFLNKFGISDKTKARRKTVSDTTFGAVFTILSMNLAFGLSVEQFVHHVYRFQRVHFQTGSGRTEWFIVFSPIVGSLILWANFKFALNLTTKQLAFGYFTPFVWLDGLFWLFVFRSLKLVFIFFVVFFILYCLAHLK